MAEPRSRATSAAILGELLLGEIRAIRGKVDENTSDTREARDGMLAIKATMAAEKVGERLAAIEGKVAHHSETVRQIVSDAIKDATTGVDARLKGHDARIKVLEEAKAKSDGARGLVGRFAALIPQFLSALAGAAIAVMTVMGLRPHH